MAFAVLITGYSKDAGQVLLKVEPPWWYADQLRNDDRFAHTNETGSYSDYDADVSLEEMREIHEEFRLAATTGVYENHEWQARIQPMLKELDEALSAGSDAYSHFHICVFEWESGLG